MKMSSIIAAVSALCAASAMALMFTRNDAPPGDFLLVEKPEWLKESEAINSADPESPDYDIERTRPKNPPTVISEMVPPEDLAAAFEKAKQPVEFNATALADSGLAAEISAGIVQAVEQSWEIYQRRVERDDQRRVRYQGQFLFAMWPSLGQLIKEGKITPRIIAIPPESRIPRNSIGYTYDVKRDRLNMNINTDAWQVQFRFTPENNPVPEIYAQIKTGQ